MKNETYLAPSCELMELEFCEGVLAPISGSTEGYSTGYQYDPFDEEYD